MSAPEVTEADLLTTGPVDELQADDDTTGLLDVLQADGIRWCVYDTALLRFAGPVHEDEAEAVRLAELLDDEHDQLDRFEVRLV